MSAKKYEKICNAKKKLRISAINFFMGLSLFYISVAAASSCSAVVGTGAQK